jgi:release factor glutamine methyltransferase
MAGEREVQFGELSIRYDDTVLEPRTWTLAQAQWAAELATDPPDGRALELCAGAGQIGLAFARLSGRPLVQVDANPRACELARVNAQAAGVDADVRCGDLLDAVQPEERFTLILADPPYISSAGTHRFARDPVLTIDGGRDGLDVARTCLALIARHLTRDGDAVLQLGGVHQHDALTGELGRHELVAVEARHFAEDRTLVHLRHA